MSKPQDEQHTPQDAQVEEHEGDELDLDPEVERDLEPSEDDAEAVKGGNVQTYTTVICGRTI